MNNLIKLHNLNIKNFLIIFISIQIALWGCVGLDVLGVGIPLLRQIISFIYIFYIPGIIILKILKIHDTNNIETIIYSVGLSISTTFFTGFCLNLIFPLIGDYKPLSLFPLMISLTITNCSLCIICYLRDKDFSSQNLINPSKLLSKPVLLLCLIPFLAIFGTYFVNRYTNNSLLLLLFIVLTCVIILIGVFDKISENLYPLTLGVITIALLFHYSLITNYLAGWDIQYEYYLANLIKNAAFWNSTTFGNTNSMLSVVMLLPIYSIIANIDMIWILKIIYPVIFSLVPLGLYEIFRQQTNNKIAFFSCFFFISYFAFFTDLLALVKQEIAELFLMLILLTIITNKLNTLNRSILLIIFSFSLIISHYGTAYIYIFFIIFTVFCIYLLKSSNLQKTIGFVKTQISSVKKYYENSHFSLNRGSDPINFNYLLLILIFLIMWYTYTSSYAALRSPVNILDTIFESSSEILNPNSVQPINIALTKTISPLHELSKFFHFFTQFLIIIGFLKVLVNKEDTRFSNQYIFIALSALTLLFAGVIIPFFASAYNTSRLYQIALIILAPFCIIGGITFFKFIFSFTGIKDAKKCIQYSYTILACFFALFLLFNSGWIYEVLNDNPTSTSLNRTLDAPLFNDREVIAAQWLFSEKNENIIHSDLLRSLLLTGFEGRKQGLIKNEKKEQNIDDYYIYLGTYNILNDQVLVTKNTYVSSATIIYPFNKIYNNQGAEIYY